MISTILMVIFSNVLPVFASDINSPHIKKSMYTGEYEEAYQKYKDDKQFNMMLTDYGSEYVEEFLKDVTNEKELTNSLLGGGGNECYQYVKNIKQTKKYNCGSNTIWIK